MNLTPVFDMLEEAGLPGGGKKTRTRRTYKRRSHSIKYSGESILRVTLLLDFTYLLFSYVQKNTTTEKVVIRKVLSVK